MKRNIRYLFILLTIILIFGGYQYFKHAGLRAYRYVGQSEVQLDSLANGRYHGVFSPFKVIHLARVKFSIEEGKVTDFTIPRLLVSPWNKVKPAIEDTVQTKRSFHFDAITGATETSRALQLS